MPAGGRTVTYDPTYSLQTTYSPNPSSAPAYRRPTYNYTPPLLEPCPLLILLLSSSLPAFFLPTNKPLQPPHYDYLQLGSLQSHVPTTHILTTHPNNHGYTYNSATNQPARGSQPQILSLPPVSSERSEP